MVKKIEDIRFDRIHECDRRTDGQIPHDGLGSASIASRGINTEVQSSVNLIKLQ